jgi:hypothetical protein
VKDWIKENRSLMNIFERFDKKEYGRILVGLFVVIFVIVFIFWKIGSNELKADHVSAVALVTNIQPVKGGVFFNYSYEVSGVKYSGSCKYWISSEAASKFIGLKFPLVYSKKNPQKSAILITENNFAFYGEVFPDSLKWVDKYFPLE